MTYEQAWIAVGLIGQFMFTGRFVVQWLRANATRKSRFQPPFGMLSIGGSLLLLTYAIHQRDLVFYDWSELWTFHLPTQLTTKSSRGS